MAEDIGEEEQELFSRLDPPQQTQQLVHWQNHIRLTGPQLKVWDQLVKAFLVSIDQFRKDRALPGLRGKVAPAASYVVEMALEWKEDWEHLLKDILNNQEQWDL